MKPRTRFVRQAARQLLKDCGITKPPVDLRVVAEKLGLGYEEVDYFPDDVEALVVPMEDRTVAVVNKNFPVNRRRFTLAHELCHHLLHKDRSVLEDTTTIDSPDLSDDEFTNKDPFEAEADIFAGELLVPLAMLKKSYQPGFTAADVARIFEVSEAAASVALLNHFSALFK
jgi:Zn-dependent peptidase ImmA (M78 family)